MKNASQIHPVNLVTKQAVLCQLGLWVGLSKVAGCWRKSPPTWLVSAGYSAWYFFTDGFLNKMSLDWPLTLTTQSSTSKLSDNPGASPPPPRSDHGHQRKTLHTNQKFNQAKAIELKEKQQGKYER